MPRCIHRRILAVFAVLVLTGLLGCTQADDIYTGIAQTDLYLKAERLPSTPPDMIYELWVASASDTVSLGKFGYSVEAKKFLELSGVNRPDSNKFTLEGDLYSYSTMFISIELATDPDPSAPGPVMLTDAITPVGDGEIELIFPNRSDSLENAVVRCCLESPSDNSRTGVGRGIWFANYRSVDLSYPDTTAVSARVDYIARAYLFAETTFVGDPPVMQIDSNFTDAQLRPISKEAVFVKVPWSVTITKDSNLIAYSSDTLVLGLDSVYHVYNVVRIDSSIDMTSPYQYADVSLNYTTVPKTIPLDIFSQDDFNLPDYSDIGWHYKGWVMTPYLSSQVVDRATMPAWYSVEALRRYFPYADEALISTGSFTDVTQPDAGNPFAVGPKVPPFPGEDFLKTSELQATYGVSSVNLMPFSVGNRGAVFITLEPDNFPIDTTNFPLVMLITELPSSRNSVDSSQVSVSLRNWTQTNPKEDLVGFPKVTVTPERF